MAHTQLNQGHDLSRSPAEQRDPELLMRQATIYVVEDDDAGRESLMAWLTARGYSAQAFPSADSFLDGAELEASGCIISDFRMPGMNGTELQAELHHRNSVLPVIMISGYTDVPVTVRAM